MYLLNIHFFHEFPNVFINLSSPWTAAIAYIPLSKCYIKAEAVWILSLH